jgi:glycosyltransferase involved in cell wall biosynthesis
MNSRETDEVTIDETPKITIITVVFNDENNIEKTILSVISQAYENLEYIIVDGGSTDRTLDIISKYDKLISSFISEPDDGIYHAMNKGIDLATGEWILFLNSSDMLFDSQVLKKINFIQPQTVQIIYGDVETRYSDFSSFYKAGNLDKLPYSMQFSHQSTFFKTSLHKNNKYSIEYKLASDFHFILSQYLLDPEQFLYQPIVVSSVSTGGVSDRKTYFSIVERWKIVKSFKLDDLSVKRYYYFALLLQFTKFIFIDPKILTWYRKIKYRLFITLSKV